MVQPSPETPRHTPPTSLPVVVVDQPPVVEPVDATLPIDRARALWKQAIDAEARKDDSAAVRIYRQIKQLPSDTWPAGLQLRLELAQKRAEQSSAR
jgi:hypothetical protein